MEEILRTKTLELRIWQKEAIDKLQKERLCKVTAFTGSGKSLAISGLTALKLSQDSEKKAIIAVPQKDISQSWIDNKINYNNNELFLKTTDLTKANKSKKKELLKFLKDHKTKGKAAVCTQQLLALSIEDLKNLKNVIFVLDEAHHSKSADDDGESNSIGSLLDELARESTNELILASATFFRGDKANILSADLERNLESYACGFDQTIQEFQYLKSVSANVNMYEESFEKSLSDYIKTFPERNAIIFIPSVSSCATSGKEQDLQYAINAIAGQNNPKVGTCEKTGFNFIKRNGKKVYFADLVSESNDRDGIKASIDNLKNTTSSRKKLHYIIALKMFKEGSDWRDCDDAHIISQRHSLTSFVQMAGRALRDAPGKKEARVIYHIPTDNKEDCCKEDINRFFGAFAHIMIFNTLTDDKIVIPARKSANEDGAERKEKKMSVVDVANELNINEQQLTDTITEVTAKLAVWDSDNPNTTEEEKIDKAKSLFKEQLEDYNPDDDHLYVLAKSLLKQNRKLSRLAEKPEDFDMDMCDEDRGLFDWISSKALDADFLSKVRDYFKSKEWLEPEEIKAFFAEYEITSLNQWETFRKNNPDLVQNVPFEPYRIYKNYSWNWFVGKEEVEYLKDEEIKQFFKDYKITNKTQWRQFRKDNPELVRNVPGIPHRTYKNYSWKWFVGKEDIVFLTAQETKQFLAEHEIKTKDEWLQFRKDNPELVKNVPGKPYQTYPEYTWNWFVGKEEVEFLKPEEIRSFFKEHGIKSRPQWRKFRKENNITNIPAVPPRVHHQYSWKWFVGKE